MGAPMPANESREHFLLKQVGIVWFKMRGCQFVGTEIDGMGGNTEADYVTTRQRRYDYQKGGMVTRYGKRSRSVADVVGVQRKFDRVCRETNRSIYKYTVRMIEVKVSRSDFMTGYCTGAHLAYVMTPPGLVVPEELQPGIGLLEVNPEVIAPQEDPGWRMERIVNLVKIVRKPRRQTEYDDDAESLVQAIAASHTNQAVFKNPWLVRGAV